MQPLSAIEAISPAFTRTNEMLFRPFSFTRSWKLCAAQYIGQIGAFFRPMPLLLAFVPGGLGIDLPRQLLNVLCFIGTLVFFGLFYLGLRMQFVNFEMVVTRATYIGPMWRRYAARVWPVVGFKVLLGSALSLAMTPFLWKSFVGLIRAIASMPRITPGQPPDPAALAAVHASLVHVMGLEGIFIAVFLVIKIFTTAFEDFVLPFFILEDIPLSAAISRGCAIFFADPLQSILYLVFKFVLFLAGFILQYISLIILMIPVIIVGIIFAILGVVLSGVLGSVGHLLGFVFGVVLYLAFIAVAIWYQFGTLGYITMVLEAYGIYFLGGRYPLLGNMLDPGIDAPFTPPPVFPSSEERDHHDDGPPMPMNPAVA